MAMERDIHSTGETGACAGDVLCFVQDDFRCRIIRAVLVTASCQEQATSEERQETNDSCMHSSICISFVQFYVLTKEGNYRRIPSPRFIIQYFPPVVRTPAEKANLRNRSMTPASAVSPWDE